jgi:hypothetical protein
MRTLWFFLALLWGGAATAECPDYTKTPLLRQLEPAASRGALSTVEVDCLEQAYTRAARLTTKNRVSRVLLVHTYVTDTVQWEALVRRHLDEVDRSDPDMAFLYAIHLHLQPDSDPEAVVRWAEVALERKQVWEGEQFVARNLALLKLRAYATARHWQQVAEDASGKVVNERTGVRPVDLLRNQTKTYAREWLDFANSAGHSTREAAELCRSAALQESACTLD